MHKETARSPDTKPLSSTTRRGQEAGTPKCCRASMPPQRPAQRQLATAAALPPAAGRLNCPHAAHRQPRRRPRARRGGRARRQCQTRAPRAPAATPPQSGSRPPCSPPPRAGACSSGTQTRGRLRSVMQRGAAGGRRDEAAGAGASSAKSAGRQSAGGGGGLRPIQRLPTPGRSCMLCCEKKGNCSIAWVSPKTPQAATCLAGAGGSAPPLPLPGPRSPHCPGRPGSASACSRQHAATLADQALSKLAGSMAGRRQGRLVLAGHSLLRSPYPQRQAGGARGARVAPPPPPHLLRSCTEVSGRKGPAVAGQCCA